MNSSQPEHHRRERLVRSPGAIVRSIAIFLSGCGVVLVVGGILTWMNHKYPSRTNDNFRQELSPDGKLKAVVFRRTCLGKENDFTTHVTILKADEEVPDRSGKAFIAQGEPVIRIHWTDNSHLVIDDPDGTHVILRATEYNGVLISDR